MSNGCEVLYESVKVTSTKRGLRIVQNNVATFEQNKKIVLILLQNFCRRRWNTYRTLTLVNYHFRFLPVFEHSN